MVNPMTEEFHFTQLVVIFDLITLGWSSKRKRQNHPKISGVINGSGFISMGGVDGAPKLG
jgi:gentisate 1,2-dioxygenase